MERIIQGRATDFLSFQIGEKIKEINVCYVVITHLSIILKYNNIFKINY